MARKPSRFIRSFRVERDTKTPAADNALTGFTHRVRVEPLYRPSLLGWPHRDRDEDLRTVVALATGSLPPEGESVYKLLQSASQQGQDLNSAFAAAMGQPDAVRTGAYQDAGRTNDEAFLFARTAVTLADQLGSRLR